MKYTDMELEIRIASHMKRNGRLLFETYIDEWDGDCRIFATKDYFNTYYSRRILTEYLLEKVVKKFEVEYPDGEYNSLDVDEEIKLLGFMVREIRGQREFEDGLNYLIFWGSPFTLVQSYQPEETLATCAEYLYDFRKYSYIVAKAILEEMADSSDSSSQSGDSDSDSEGIAVVGVAGPSNALAQKTGGKTMVNTGKLAIDGVLPQAKVNGIVAVGASGTSKAMAQKTGGKTMANTAMPVIDAVLSPAKVNTDGAALQPNSQLQDVTLETPNGSTFFELRAVDFSEVLSSLPMTPQ